MSNPYFSLLKHCWEYAHGSRVKYVVIYFMFILSSAGKLVNPMLYGWLIYILQNEKDNILSSSWIYAGAYLLLQLTISALHAPARVMERKLAFQIAQTFLSKFFQILLDLPIEWHKSHHTGASINRLKKAYDSIKLFFQNGFTYLYTFVEFIFSWVAMIYFSWQYGIVALFLGALTIWVIFKFDKPFIKTLNQVNEKEHLASANMTDSLFNIMTIITLKLEKRVKIGLLQKINDILPFFNKNVIINEWKWFSASVLIWVIYIIMVIGYIHGNYIPGETFQVGGLVALLGYVTMFTNAFNSIASAYTNIVEMHTNVNSVHMIKEASQRFTKDKHFAPLPEKWSQIEIRNLHFAYQLEFKKVNEGDKKQRIAGLNNVDLAIKKGQKIALVGESGSGKSTLLAVLRGLYKPNDKYSLTVDNQKGYTWTSLNEEVTLFPQEPEIFEETIWYNITLGLPFEKSKVIQACKSVCFDEVLEKLPNGFETIIQENGNNLSGGQKQRLALARGMLAANSSSILLFDEATSSIDTQTENKIYENLLNKNDDRILICSVHGLHLLEMFDYIYILDKGKIIDQGTFDAINKSGYLNTPKLHETKSVN